MLTERGMRLVHVWAALASGLVAACTMSTTMLGALPDPHVVHFLGFALLAYLAGAVAWLVLFVPVWAVRRPLPSSGRPTGAPENWPRIQLSYRGARGSLPSPVRRNRAWLWARVGLAVIAGIHEGSRSGSAGEGVVTAVIVFGFTWVLWISAGAMRRYVGWPTSARR